MHPRCRTGSVPAVGHRTPAYRRDTACLVAISACAEDIPGGGPRAPYPPLRGRVRSPCLVTLLRPRHGSDRSSLGRQGTPLPSRGTRCTCHVEHHKCSTARVLEGRMESGPLRLFWTSMGREPFLVVRPNTVGSLQLFCSLDDFRIIKDTRGGWSVPCDVGGLAPCPKGLPARGLSRHPSGGKSTVHTTTLAPARTSSPPGPFGARSIHRSGTGAVPPPG